MSRWKDVLSPVEGFGIIIIAVLFVMLLSFAALSNYYRSRYTVACEYIAESANVTDDVKALVKTAEGCEIYVKNQRGKR